MKNLIRVGVDIRDLRIAKTGARTYLEEIIRQFKRGRAGYEFYFFDTAIDVYTGKSKFWKALEHLRFFWWKQVILPYHAWKSSCDILFCTDFFVPYFQPGFKAVPVFHDAFFWQFPEHYNRIWLKVFKTIGLAAAKGSVMIVTPTQHAKQSILSFFNYPAERMVVISEGPKTLTHYKNTQLAEGIEPGKYFLHIGVFEKRKNLVRLLEAFSILREKGCDVKLVLGGSFSPKEGIDDSKNILAMVKEKSLEEFVIMPGFIPDSRLSAYYKSALSYIFPSTNEGFGLPLLEAFQHDLPVLAANNSCLPEVGGDAILTFDPLDDEDIAKKMMLITENPALRDEMIAKGQKRLAQFSWENTANVLLENFKRIAAGEG